MNHLYNPAPVRAVFNEKGLRQYKAHQRQVMLQAVMMVFGLAVLVLAVLMSVVLLIARVL